ncbi:hypothetical protein FQR65_LT09588 [Abscondita terminalis]|nr:hypothetical protein FQR65_LT09588 [Abscondita terminalis]
MTHRFLYLSISSMGEIIFSITMDGRSSSWMKRRPVDNSSIVRLPKKKDKISILDSKFEEIVTEWLNEIDSDSDPIDANFETPESDFNTDTEQEASETDKWDEEHEPLMGPNIFMGRTNSNGANVLVSVGTRGHFGTTL